jgi:DNA-binding MarR family transcriptional regulator
LAARKHARQLSRFYDSHLAPAELSVSQFSILALLEAHGQLKITELADMLGMERTSLVRALKPLQSSGRVIAERPDSRRSFDVKLTRRGYEKVAQALPLWKSAQAAFEREVGRDRAVRLRDEACSAFRGRDGHCWPPPAQIRTGPIKASGSYLGCLTSKRTSGQG